MSYAIAIDGPSGAGKSTIAKRVAKELSFIYVDTGAMYRAMALYVLEQNIDPQDQAKVAAVCPDIDVTILYEDGVQQVLLNGKNVSTEIRQEIVGNTASKISVIKEVREKLVALQRQLAAKENVVMDGRDIGTQVLPDATVKIYLTASAKERAKRRYLELQEKGMPGELDQIEADIIERDNRDMNREISPLRQAEDAVLVDASFMGIEEVTAAVIAEFEKKKQVSSCNNLSFVNDHTPDRHFHQCTCFSCLSDRLPHKPFIHFLLIHHSSAFLSSYLVSSLHMLP